MKYQWGDRIFETYHPKPKKSRQIALYSLIGADLILPATFGAGIMLAKTILKLNPLFLYK